MAAQLHATILTGLVAGVLAWAACRHESDAAKHLIRWSLWASLASSVLAVSLAALLGRSWTEEFSGRRSLLGFSLFLLSGAATVWLLQRIARHRDKDDL